MGARPPMWSRRPKPLAGRSRRLRNDWQRTGESTDDTKRRLAELANETARYAGELKTADGGTQRFGRQLASSPWPGAARRRPSTAWKAA